MIIFCVILFYTLSIDKLDIKLQKRVVTLKKLLKFLYLDNIYKT